MNCFALLLLGLDGWQAWAALILTVLWVICPAPSRHEEPKP